MCAAMFPLSDRTREEETSFLVNSKNATVRSKRVESCLLSSVLLVILNISGLNVSHKREAAAAIDGHFNPSTETLNV